jgi:ABC-type transporter Mla maintaining outer membrane lipid asymmetry permease subunit MlaE
MLDIPPIEYYNQTHNTIQLGNFGVGVGPIKTAVFAVTVAMEGCMGGYKAV